MSKFSLSNVQSSKSSRKQPGASAVEYAILVALIAAAVAAAVSLFDIQGIFTSANTAVSNAMK